MSKIEWTEKTWNPIGGCSVVSPGCGNCYAMRIAGRLGANPATPHYKGLTFPSKAGPVWNGKIAVAPKATWTAPLRRRKPTTWFVNSMGDLFHENVPDDWIDRVFAVMALGGQRDELNHTFQVLTKRPERARVYLSDREKRIRRINHLACHADGMPWCSWRYEHERAGVNVYLDPLRRLPSITPRWPLPNVWLGVSAEDQARAEERIPLLLDTPAAVRFVSCEPLLGPLDLRYLTLVPRVPGSLRAGIHIDALAGKYVESGLAYTGEWDIDGPPPPETDRRSLDWVICGGESGPGARPMHPDWARSLRDQCRWAGGVPFFFKQWGAWAPWDDDNWSLPEGCDDGVARRQALHLDGVDLLRVGKRAAGRRLDGREWNELPVPASPEATQDPASERGA